MNPNPERVQDKQGADPNRVGGPTNHLLSDGGLSTVIAGASNKTNAALTSSLQRLQSRSGGGAERSLQSAFRAIGQMAEKLGLLRVIKDRACELYKQVRGVGPLGGMFRLGWSVGALCSVKGGGLLDAFWGARLMKHLSSLLGVL